MDMDDLGYRLLQHLTGEVGSAESLQDVESFVLIARSMGPAELLDYDRDKLRGLVVEEASYNSHVAIVARALNIPVVGSIRYLLSQIEEGAPVVVDGDAGVVVIRPGADFQSRIEESRDACGAPERTSGNARSRRRHAGRSRSLFNDQRRPAGGFRLRRRRRGRRRPVAHGAHLYAASGVPEHGGAAQDLCANFRRRRRPAVLFRTFDIGGDKLLPYFSASEDENPAMGWRALRIALDRPGMLSAVKGLIEAAGGGSLHVMFPMVSEVAEFDEAEGVARP